MQKDQLYRALDVCVQSIQSGLDLDQVLNQYPKWRRELAPLIRSAYVAHQLGQSSSFSPDDFGLERQKFLQAAQMVIPDAHPITRPLRWRGCAFFFVIGLMLSLIFSGAVFLSYRALPGSVFYGFKETSRDIRLSLIDDSQEYIQTSLLMDQERLQEIQTLIEQRREATVRFGGRITRGEADDWLVHDFKLVSDNETRLVGDIWPGYYVRVEGLLRTDGVIIAQRIQSQQFLIRGNVESLTPERMVVDGVEILLAPDTLLQGDIAVGVGVHVMALLADEGLYRARLIKVMDANSVNP
jgi:hypothetical protein